MHKINTKAATHLQGINLTKDALAVLTAFRHPIWDNLYLPHRACSFRVASTSCSVQLTTCEIPSFATNSLEGTCGTSGCSSRSIRFSQIAAASLPALSSSVFASAGLHNGGAEPPYVDDKASRGTSCCITEGMSSRGTNLNFFLCAGVEKRRCHPKDGANTAACTENIKLLDFVWVSYISLLYQHRQKFGRCMRPTCSFGVNHTDILFKRI